MIRSLSMLMVYLFLYIPILILIILSFNDSQFSTHWGGFTLKWYFSLFQNENLLSVTMNSILLACISASLATFMGTVLAIIFRFFRTKSTSFMKSLVYILLLSPDLVLGIAFLILFVSLGLEPGFLSLLIGHTSFCLPFVVVTVLARLQDFDLQILEAAYDLGAQSSQAIRLVLIPNISPAIISSWLLSFTLSMDDVIVSFFVTGPSYEVLPLKIYSMVRLGIKPEVNALCTLVFLLSLSMVLGTRLLARKSQ